jgi:hypothetical protein
MSDSQPQPDTPNLPTIRHDGWTPSRQRLFLETLAGTGVVRIACRVADMSAEAAYRFRFRTEGLAFRLGWEAASQIARRRLCDDLMERALEGQVEEISRTEEKIRRHRYDNRLALGMLSHLDKVCREESADARLASLIEDDFSAYLDLVQKEGTLAALQDFVSTRIDRKTAEFLGNGRCQLRDMMNAKPLLLEGDFDDESEDPEPYVPHSPQSYAEGGDVWQEEDGEWVTNFPPPPGFEGDEEGRAADNEYSRSLTPAELAIVEAREEATEAEFHEAGAEARDAYFGFTPPSQAALDAKAARDRKAAKDRAEAREKAEAKRISAERAEAKRLANVETKRQPEPANDTGPEPAEIHSEPSAPPVRAKAPPPVPTRETGPIRVVDPETGIASIYMVPPQSALGPPQWLLNMKRGW